MTARLHAPTHLPMYRHELAISAVPYDAILVDELSERLALRLGSAPHWNGQVTPDFVDGDGSPFDQGASRLTLVLHQRLWQHEGGTQNDATEIVQRLRARPDSVRVVTLDAHPIPQWLAAVPRCSLSAVGVTGVVDFAVAAVVACDGTARSASTRTDATPPVVVNGERGVGAPPPFLAQPRAFSSLRREFDALALALTPRTKKGEPAAEPPTELQTLPNRLVLQTGAVALSFSWVAGRLGTVGDGRLLVIEWEGAVTRRGGTGSLNAATAVRERIYRVEASDREGWRWRVDDTNGRAYSTANLAGEWLASALIAAV